MLDGTYYPTPGLFHIVPEKTVEISNMITSIRELLHRENYPADYDFLVDLRGVTDVENGYAQMSRFISSQEKFYQTVAGPKRSIFIAPSDLTYGMSRMFEQMAAGRLASEMFVTRREERVTELLGLTGANLDDALARLPRGPIDLPASA